MKIFYIREDTLLATMKNLDSHEYLYSWFEIDNSAGSVHRDRVLERVRLHLALHHARHRLAWRGRTLGGITLLLLLNSPSPQLVKLFT